VTTRLRTVDPFVGGFVASVAIVGLAVVLVPLRSWLGNNNIALVLVVGVVAAAAIGGRAAGIAGAIAAAFAYNFFHTRPHYTLQIHARVDRVTTALLLIVGVLVGEIVVRAQRAREVADTREGEVIRLRRAAHLAASSDPDQLIPALQEEIGRMLGLWFCRFQQEPLERPLPRLTRQGVTVPSGVPPVTGDPNTWAVELPVSADGQEWGRFVLVPHDVNAAGRFEPDARRDAVALADELGAVLAARGRDAQ
jgi:hypothetical protein